MIGTALAALAAQTITLPNVTEWSAEQRIAYLAETEARIPNRIYNPLYADPRVRTEIRRVGFSAGCAAMGEATREVVDAHIERLRPYFIAAIRNRIPEAEIMRARFLSFLASPLMIYQNRVVDEAERTAAAELAIATDELKSAFFSRTSELPTTSDPSANIVIPRADIGQALGVEGAWDLDNQYQVAMACAEQRISPENRPTITGGGRIPDRERRH